MFRTTRLFLYAVIAVAVSLAVIAIVIRSTGVTLSESEVRTVIVDTFLRDREESFFVTGTVTFSTSVISESAKTFLPGVLNLDLGMTQATVRAPGRAAYGFDTRILGGEDITLAGDTVTIRLPALEVFAVEPDLEQVEIQVDVGWARLYRDSGQAQTLAALRQLQPAMRARATTYLSSSDVPNENTVRAVEGFLRPVLAAAGLDEPIFRFVPRPVVLLPAG